VRIRAIIDWSRAKMHLRVFERAGSSTVSLSDSRTAWRIVLALLFVYVLSFFLLYPGAITCDDEATYLVQARLLAAGHSTVLKVNPLTGEKERYGKKYYPPGTALAMAPFIAIAGWRGAYLVPLLGVVGSILITAYWLQEEGRSPLFALLV